MKNNLVVMIIITALVGAAGFFGGVKYQESKPGGTNFTRQFPAGQNGQGRFSGGNRPVIGEILSVDDKSITLKLPDGSSKIVLLSDKTSINKASEASKSDLKAGERVLATGTDNSDGSVTAQNIQLNPTFGGMGNRQPSQSPTQ